MKIECPNCNTLDFNYISTNGLEWIYECKNCETKFSMYELAEEEDKG